MNCEWRDICYLTCCTRQYYKSRCTADLSQSRLATLRCITLRALLHHVPHRHASNTRPSLYQWQNLHRSNLTHIFELYIVLLDLRILPSNYSWNHEQPGLLHTIVPSRWMILKAGYIFFSTIASESVCNFLDTLSWYVLNLVLSFSSSVCSLSRGVLSNVTVTAYGEVWTKYQTTVGLPSKRG